MRGQESCCQFPQLLWHSEVFLFYYVLYCPSFINLFCWLNKFILCARSYAWSTYALQVIGKVVTCKEIVKWHNLEYMFYSKGKHSGSFHTLRYLAKVVMYQKWGFQLSLLLKKERDNISFSFLTLSFKIHWFLFFNF